jgi:hypothetical protein
MMNNNERLEKEITETIGVLDGFTHPVVSHAFSEQMTRQMAAQYRQDRLRRILFRVGSPMATAAMIAIVGVIMFSDVFHPVSETSLVTTANQTVSEADTLLAEWAEQEQNAYGLFSDLDFQVVTQASATQPAVSSTEDEWNSILIEVFDIGSAG